MKVVRLFGARDVRVVDEPVPVPGAGEELVRVTAVGICGSDLHWYSDSGIGSDTLSRPIVLGHEASGVIESGPNRGRRVAIDPAITCGTCDQCEAGHGHFCRTLRFAGDGFTDGLLREYTAWPARSLVLVPDGLSEADIAMLEPLGVALHALRLARVLPGARVGVFGVGPIGQLLIRLLRASGATTILATDVLPHRLEAAGEAGATVVELAGTGTERARLMAATGGKGLDVAFEAAGEDDAVQTSMTLAKPGGTVVLVGIPHVDRLTFTASVARRKGLTIKLSRRMNRVYPDVIRMVEQGLIDVRPLVTATRPFAECGPAFAAAAAREGSKIVLRP